MIAARRGVAGPYVNLEGQKPTYCIGFSGITFLNGVTLALHGSSSKVMRVTLVEISEAVSTAAGQQDVGVSLWTTAGTGGTIAATLPPVAYDSNDPASTSAGLDIYTAAPSAGTQLFLGGRKLISTPTGTPVVVNGIRWDFAVRPARCPVLRGSGQLFLIKGFSAAVAGQVCNGRIEWTEE